jgi:putative transposase
MATAKQKWTYPLFCVLRSKSVLIPFRSSAGWLALVDQPQTDAEVAAVRESVRRGRPFGDPTWQRVTAERLGLQSTLRPRGRPRKTAE